MCVRVLVWVRIIHTIFSRMRTTIARLGHGCKTYYGYCTARLPWYLLSKVFILFFFQKFFSIFFFIFIFFFFWILDIDARSFCLYEKGLFGMSAYRYTPTGWTDERVLLGYKAFRALIRQPLISSLISVSHWAHLVLAFCYTPENNIRVRCFLYVI